MAVMNAFLNELGLVDYGTSKYVFGRWYTVSGAWDFDRDRYLIVVMERDSSQMASDVLLKRDVLMMNKDSVRNCVDQMVARLVKELNQNRAKVETRESRLRKRLQEAIHEAKELQQDATLWWYDNGARPAVVEILIDKILRIVREAEKEV